MAVDLHRESCRCVSKPLLNHSAVAHLCGRWAFTGFLAWVLWLVVDLFKLIGFRNRLLVLTSWGWDYIFFERVVRIILPSEERRPKDP